MVRAMKTEYELMVVLHFDKSMCCPDGIDTEPLMVGNALSVIRRLLRDDSSVSGYKLVKKVSKR